MAQARFKHFRKLWNDQEKYHEPWTSGIIDLSGSQLSLLLKLTNTTWHHFEIGAMTRSDIALLVDKCAPATFGRGPEDVLDESYRKALKLDQDAFCWRFNPDSGEFVARLAQELCPWDSFESGIRVEPYKLNVYGKGGFFKTHKDTPRAENMFGSLVFTLPTEHQGGNLNLRHRGRELSFDAVALLRSAPPTSVAYVAFYSDVDHEVLEVTSGHRVTITFNLYFDNYRAPSILPAKKLNVPMNPFMSALSEIVGDRGFIARNKYLGFGLEHRYPKQIRGYQGADNEFRRKEAKYLKGPDALLFRSLQEMGLDPQLVYLYEASSLFNSSPHFWVLRSEIIDGQEAEYAVKYDNSFEYLLQDEDTYIRIVWKEGKSLKTLKMDQERSPWSEAYLKHIEMCKPRSIRVSWVTEPTSNLKGETHYIELGNDAQQEIYYFNICIIVDLSYRSYAGYEDTSEDEDTSGD